ncbi:hypothetical protein [Tropicimonas sp. IMCC6043]|uniref:hypothetical protein n=1 Tax=Tropicimonas sp. IMCC6043 TaxID=2510645 RepID=UPI00101C9DD1|nr:hypothetical protein [Tropicimonas sp. IMCC6043]RYH11590.1 hypothetical protein EU800_02840 [Tropicimonas sp. IMCC6043]
MLLGSLAAQLSSAALARAFPAASGMTALALGIAATLAGGALLSDFAAALGCLVAGAGAGLSFRCALVLLTRGASPAGQGRLASAYAAITYLAAAALVLLCGALVNRFGSTDVTMALFAATAAAALSARRFAPRIGRLTTP